MPKVQGYWILHEGLIGVLGDAGLQEITFTDAIKDGASKTFKQTGGWLGMTDKYWAAALIPDQKSPYRGSPARRQGDRRREGPLRGRLRARHLRRRRQARSARRPTTCSPAPSRSTLIQAYGEKLGTKQFDLLIDWGWFWFITKPLFKLLHWL